VAHPSAHRDGPDPGQLLSVRSLPGARTGHVVVEVTGEVDAYTAPLLDVCLRSHAGRRGVREVVVDLRGVTFLGAAGVTALAAAQRRCRMLGARLVIRAGGRSDVERSLQSAGLALRSRTPG
jgi:anti-sigma B factor antagonist